MTAGDKTSTENRKACESSAEHSSRDKESGKWRELNFSRENQNKSRSADRQVRVIWAGDSPRAEVI